MNSQLCPQCNTKIAANAPGQLCPSCVLRGVENPEPASQLTPPSLAEIGAAFPELEVLSLLGQGGMGIVYQVRQPELDRTAALKVLSPTLSADPAFAERFAREARILGKLQHPNIVTIFESGENGGFFYLLMEYVDGVNLRQAMQTGRFSSKEALAVVPGICDGLQAAHSVGVWHRDIKPENILLDKDGAVKIVDFGIARLIGDPQRNFTLTLTGQALGSSAYMAPEQHEKPHEVDHRADIYSLGVVIYELLTGELPLGRFPTPAERSEVDAHIDKIVLKTLEKERSLRQQSAFEVKTDLQSTPPQNSKRAHNSSPQIENQPSLFDNPHKFLVTTLALFLGGLAGIKIGIISSPLIFGLGCLSTAFGLAGSGWILWRIRHNSHPSKHRIPLLLLAFWPLVGVITLLSIQPWLAWDDQIWRQSKQDPRAVALLPLIYTIVALILPLLCGQILWTLFGKKEASPSAKPWKIILSFILAISSVLMVSYQSKKRLTYHHVYVSTFQIAGDINWPDDSELLQNAALSILSQESNLKSRILPPHERTSSRDSYPNILLEFRSKSRQKAIQLQRKNRNLLKASLPKRVDIHPQGVEETPESVNQFDFIKLLVIYPLIATFAVTILLINGSKKSFILISGSSLVIATIITCTSWPSSTSYTESIDEKEQFLGNDSTQLHLVNLTPQELTKTKEWIKNQ